MKSLKLHIGLILLVAISLFSCTNDTEPQLSECNDNEFDCVFEDRNFALGFTTWPYAPTETAIDETYQFLADNGDIYSEHIDAQIPWDAWMNNNPLPPAFSSDIAARALRKISDSKLTVSVSLLNNARDELASDFDGTVPSYDALDDIHIENAFFKHLKYITEQLNPEYLIIALEVNELLKNSPDKWDSYKSLITKVRLRIKEEFPGLEVSESITLHNFYQPDVANSEEFIEEITNYANSLDFVPISFYPFFKGLSKKEDFQKAFDFLHSKINQPIVFSETGHLSEDLTIDSFDLFIPSDESEQNTYLESLLINASEQQYEYVIWWTHRDYNELWNTFPDDVKDLGKIWISTGIINEDGQHKMAFDTWKSVVVK